MSYVDGFVLAVPPASNEEMIIRINMAMLGDARFVPVDERTGTLE